MIIDEAELKRIMLACELGISRNDVEVMCTDIFAAEGKEFLIVDDGDAENMAAEYVRDIVESDIQMSNLAQYIKDSIDIESVVEYVLDSDGRGPSLASYDGEEKELYSKKYNKWFFAYRIG